MENNKVFYLNCGSFDLSEIFTKGKIYIPSKNNLDRYNSTRGILAHIERECAIVDPDCEKSPQVQSYLTILIEHRLRIEHNIELDIELNKIIKLER